MNRKEFKTELIVETEQLAKDYVNNVVGNLGVDDDGKVENIRPEDLYDAYVAGVLEGMKRAFDYASFCYKNN
jgi:hypothetical protein